MRATWMDDGTTIDPKTLAAEGGINGQLPLDAAGYQPTMDELKEERGYIEQDTVELRPDNPNLEAICQKFDDEHLHDEDEVRFVLEGEGIFDIRSTADRWMRVVVEAGDLIVEVAQEPVATPAEVAEKVEVLTTGGRKTALLLLSNGNGELRFVAIRLDD